jgi:hypothetical protein
MTQQPAPLSSSLFMMEREMPSYLSTAHSIRYPSESEQSSIAKTWNTIQSYFSLIKELITYRPRASDFKTNILKLNADFQKINQKIAQNDKPICAYFVSTSDHNGAILGDQLYYYHHYKIQNFEQHYAVAPKMVTTQAEIKDFLRGLKERYPNRQIKVVDIVSHGYKSILGVSPSASNPKGNVDPSNLQERLFEHCAEDATIILDACSTGEGNHNIADEIARSNPKKTVLAPGHSLYFSKPVISTENGSPKIDHVVHGFALVNAYSFKKFRHDATKCSQPLYTKDANLFDDFFQFSSSLSLATSRFDRFINLVSNEQKKKVLDTFNSLSLETQTLIKYQVWKNHGEPLDRGHDFGGDFLKANPTDKTVYEAFRTVFADLKEDLFNTDLTNLTLIKILLWAAEEFLVIKLRLFGAKQN